RWLPGDEAHTSSVPAESAGGRAGRVLIVDDNADMRGYLCRVLAPHVEVEAVPDGIAALDAARRRPPDLVLTDVMMPRLDGFGLLRAIREDAALRSIPVIMLSARAGEESRVEGLQAGADDYLVKPFAPREVVARVRTHLELSRLRRDAERELARLEQFFEQAPAVVCVLSGPEHVYRLANPPYLETIGKRAVLGLPIRQVLPELEGQGVFEILDRVYARGERFVGSEVPIKLDRGEGLVDTFWNLVYQPYRDPHGTVEGVVVFGFEITDHVLARRRAEELTQQLRVSEAQAAAASRAKDEFFAVLGHELRNPLAPILTALQIMRLRGVETTKEQLIIERQTQHMVRLVDDLLDVSRIARGKIELKKRRLEAAEVVARGLEVASPLLEQKQHRLELEVPRHGLALDGDLDRLAQVVGNLLTNAAKYTESGGQITVTAERSDGQILIRVKDTGIGIAPEMLPHVFDMFVQESQALDRSRGGLGLGLTITRNLVELHGGRIEARSAGRGSGAELLVWLPAAAGAHAGRDADRTRGDVAVGKPAGTHRVLVVDDNDDSAMLLAAALEHMGFTVAVAYDGPEALQVASTFDPDVALLDIGLPVMDGYELARRLQDQLGRTNRHDRLRLVALTGYGQDSDLQQSREAGFDAHLVKPVDMQEISAVITRLTRDAPSPAKS
ncbi:MAG TPA: response regulator, partial [Kofleriaceae bacterium]|nr:response regulator [Kofleriaceae bacterium]